MFDLDGTLVDVREGYIEESIGHTLKVFGAKYTPSDAQKIWLEAGRDELVRKLTGLSNPEDFWDEFKKYDTADRRLANVFVYDETRAVLSSVRKLGYNIGVVTSSHRKVAFAEIDLVGKDHFDSIVCAAFSEGIKPKPDPQGLEMCLDELETGSSLSLYVGDNAGDILAAENAGVLSVLVNRKGKTFDCKPDFTMVNLYELLEIL